MLSPRRKWGKERLDVQVGNLVLILMTHVPHGKWPLGRTVQVFPGPDSLIRIADARVKVQFGTTIVKLCPFECHARTLIVFFYITRFCILLVILEGERYSDDG